MILHAVGRAGASVFGGQVKLGVGAPCHRIGRSHRHSRGYEYRLVYQSPDVFHVARSPARQSGDNIRYLVRYIGIYHDVSFGLPATAMGYDRSMCSFLKG